ncbi:MAG: hypothetical protein V2A59_03140 [Candidatus Omnitrophota bacterium]
MKKNLFIVSTVLCLQMVLLIESGFCGSSCEEECYPQGMQTMIEGRVAQMNCLQTCRQRKVWEQMVLSIDRLTVQLADQAKEKGSEEDVTTVNPYRQQVNFTEAEPNITRSNKGPYSMTFGSTTRSNTVLTNTTLVSPTFVNTTFANTTQ